ncbi:hypothetical protein [Kineosporia sp. NBRC 101731]|uniref:hypothetical protein n=1 Tax=Kineosporia sp. NBRC 101731 TaxID=3032199 RepID=UPI0024A3D406|nr:hypothetical protein [Kineosporia sp. NBRC 101731]GLY33777.1 hypothetical protein Kisp02_71420 [Kineosporia sp. NBRC 101731]
MTSPAGDDPNGAAQPQADEMAAAVAEFARQRDELAVITHRMETETVEVTSPDGLITVTSALNGAITGLSLAGEEHRDLTGAALAAKLLEALVTTREAAQAAALQVAGPLVAGPGPAGTMVPGDPLGDALADLDALFRNPFQQQTEQDRL